MSGRSVVDGWRGASDFTPSAVLSGGGSVVVGFEAVAATLRALYRPGNPRAEAAGIFIVSAFDDELRAVALRSASTLERENRACQSGKAVPYWRRWLAGVRDASLAVCDAYWSRFCVGGLASEADFRLRLAVSVVEALKWNACERCPPDDALWSRLSALVMDSGENDGRSISGGGSGIGRQYVKAFALHSAGLDQLTLQVALAVFHLIDLCLPFLSLSRAAGNAPQYVASPADAPVPRRQLRPDGSARWHFAPWAADELLDGFENRLLSGVAFPMLDRFEPACYLAAVRHLRQAWATSPPMRLHRRYAVDGTISVARGFAECRDCVAGGCPASTSMWSVRDVSLGGVSATLPGVHVTSLPLRDELIGLQFVDGSGWHLHVVRRVLLDAERATLGARNLSRRAVAAILRDEHASVDVLLCDQPVGREIVDIVAPAGQLCTHDIVSLVWSGDEVLTLKFLATSLRGNGFELRRYQVL